MNTIALPADLAPATVHGIISGSAQETSRGLGAQLLANRTMSEMFSAFYRSTRAYWDFHSAVVVNRAPRPIGPAHVRYFVTRAADTQTLAAIAAPAEYRAEVDEKGATVTVFDEFGASYVLPIRSGLERTLRREGLGATAPLTAGRLTVRIVCD
jgi:hypothetical protein